MASWDKQLYLALLICTLGISLYRWKFLSKADRWICLLLLITIIQENIANYFYQKFGNNLITYHFYTPVELCLIVLYFNSSLRLGNSMVFGGFAVLICIALALINVIFFQPLSSFNSYYLLFEGCIVIGLCLLSLYKLLIREEVIPNKMVHFWFIICFLFYWSLTYANFGLYSESVKVGGTVDAIFNWALYFANYLFYLGIAIVFIRYKKLIPSGD